MSLADGHHPVPPGKLAVIVTWLEMARPADPPPAPLDLAPETLAPDAYRALFRAVGAEFLWQSRLRMADAELSDLLAEPDRSLRVPRMDGRPAGMLELVDHGDAVELAFLGLIPGARGAGLGRALMATAQALAFARADRLWLHTCTLDDPRALPFYRAAGFTPTHRTVELFDDPRATGLLPPDAAPGVPIL
jgi:GNAT superfamily N-acetyltransferase